MRAVLILAAFVLWITGSGQVPAPAYELEEVVQVDSSLKAHELLRKATQWLLDRSLSIDEGIQSRDPLTHTLVGNNNFKIITKGPQEPDYTEYYEYAYYSIEIRCSDGQYRVRLYAVRWGGYPVLDKALCVGDCPLNGREARRCRKEELPLYSSVCKQIRTKASMVLATLREAMVRTDEDW